MGSYSEQRKIGNKKNENLPEQNFGLKIFTPNPDSESTTIVIELVRLLWKSQEPNLGK